MEVGHGNRSVRIRHVAIGAENTRHFPSDFAEVSGLPTLTAHPYESLAMAMVDEQLIARGVTDSRVLDAMRHMPRHAFVPTVSPTEAYADKALPTSGGQTISQPFIVARMTSMLRLEPDMKVLEIGTGSGYQTALLAYLGARVTTVERDAELSQFARSMLQQLKLDKRVELFDGDGSLGHDSNAPYDRIIVTAAAPHVPCALQDQLVDGGRIVIPVGSRTEQELVVWSRNGKLWTQHVDCQCRFVLLIGVDAWES